MYTSAPGYDWVYDSKHDLALSHNNVGIKMNFGPRSVHIFVNDMSDEVNGVAEAMEKLHLDAATGEMVSKRYASRACSAISDLRLVLVVS
jgi:hypothetical protein